MGPNANSTNATPFSFLCQSQSQIWDEATIWKAGHSSGGTNSPAWHNIGQVVFTPRDSVTAPTL